MLLIAGLSATGCFYVDPINDRPQVAGVQRLCPPPADGIAAPLPCDAEFDNVHRGDAVQVHALAHDPDGDDQRLRYHWQVFACSDEAACDTAASIDIDDQPTPMTAIPKMVPSSELPVHLVHIAVATTDDRGAQTTALRSVVLDDGPTLGVRVEPQTTSVGGAVGVYATYGDPDGPADDPAADVQLTWTLTSPAGQVTHPTTERPILDPPVDPLHQTVARTLVLDQVGDWSIAVAATDDHGKQTQQAQTVHVLDDQPPCLAQWQPIAATAPATLPISAPTLFQVPLVSDDLDPYPAMSGAGSARFAWSIHPPGEAAFQALAGATGNSVALDPSAYRPGDVVELRVEITDRAHPAPSCPADQPTCSLAGTTCIQRQTWRVEAR